MRSNEDLHEVELNGDDAGSQTVSEAPPWSDTACATPVWVALRSQGTDGAVDTAHWVIDARGGEAVARIRLPALGRSDR